MSNSMRASSIIESIRKIFSSENPTKQPVDLHSIIVKAKNLLQYDNVADVKINLDFCEVDNPVVGDQMQIEQVICNLLQNAVDAVAAKGYKEKIITIKTIRRGSYIKTSVIDNGIGFNPETRDKMFEPFVSTKAKGMGIGLAICRSIVESHGGCIDATSNGSSNTEVWFTLPFAKNSSMQSSSVV